MRISESHIINILRNHFPISGGIGDDAAILPLSDTQRYVVTKDLLIEDVHFRTTYFDAVHLAHKALHVNLSDIVAMGAIPKYVLLGIAVPAECSLDVENFLAEFSCACKAANVELIGGDTTKSPDKLMVSVTAIGIADKAYLKFRHQAQAGDIICVAGNLGDSYVGLQALEKNISGFEKYKNDFLNPQARLREGEWLGKQSAVTAMMDISDGLAVDLQKLCAASQLSAEIELENIHKIAFDSPSAGSLPARKNANKNNFITACEILNIDPLVTQLIGGEDYGLLFTVKSADYLSVSAEFFTQFDYALKTIGKMFKHHPGEVIFTQGGTVIQLALKPFSHFGEL